MDFTDIYIQSASTLIYLLLFVSAIGSFVPVIPGPFLASLSILGFKIIFPESPLTWSFVIFAQILMICAQVADLVLTWLGAKKFGATWRGASGAFIGVIVGLFIPPQIIWIFIAPILLAFLFEYLGGADFRAAGKAGIGAFIGTIAASVFKFLTVVAMTCGYTIYMYF